jgi:hypothetical protein
VLYLTASKLFSLSSVLCASVFVFYGSLRVSAVTNFNSACIRIDVVSRSVFHVVGHAVKNSLLCHWVSFEHIYSLSCSFCLCIFFTLLRRCGSVLLLLGRLGFLRFLLGATKIYKSGVMGSDNED